MLRFILRVFVYADGGTCHSCAQAVEGVWRGIGVLRLRKGRRVRMESLLRDAINNIRIKVCGTFGRVSFLSV